MFKRSPSLTEQTKLYLKERILNNEFSDGRIPSEPELAVALGVSRTTVREALSRLENEGAIIRKQGAGTFVNQPGLQIKTRLEEIWSYESALRAHGYTPAVKVLRVYETPATAALAQALALSEGVAVLVIEKLFLEDETPAIFTLNSIPKRLLIKSVDEESVQVPVYDFLEAHCQQHLLYYLSEIVPMVAQNDLATVLDVRPNTALFSFEEIGYNTDNLPIVKAVSYFRDDLIRFRLIRRRA